MIEYKETGKEGRVAYAHKNKYNKLYKKLDNLSFLKNTNDYNLEDLEELIKIIFPHFRPKSQLKVSIVTISFTFSLLPGKLFNCGTKRCDDNILIKAFENCQFIIKDDIIDFYPNISLSDFTLLNNLFSRW